MSRENPNEHLDAMMEPEAQAPGTTKRPDEYAVRTQRVFESWEHPKKTVLKDQDPKAPKDAPKEYVTVADTTKPPIKVTKLVNGEFGPFRNRAIAEQVAAGMANLDHTVSAIVITVVDAPEEQPQAERQVPASEDVLCEMVKDGKVPGVPADATVRVENEDEPQAVPPMPDNVVAFAAKKPGVDDEIPDSLPQQ